MALLSMSIPLGITLDMLRGIKRDIEKQCLDPEKNAERKYSENNHNNSD